MLTSNVCLSRITLKPFLRKSGVLFIYKSDMQFIAVGIVVFYIYLFPSREHKSSFSSLPNIY